jgi:hypothetical protein
MVTALVSGLGKSRPVCFSRFYLNRSLDAIKRGDTIAAGCLLREAIDRWLKALCDYHKVYLGKNQLPSPKVLLRALSKAKQIDGGAYRWCSDAIDIGNKLAHCRPVRPHMVTTCIELMHYLMDLTPELIFPIREGGVL